MLETSVEKRIPIDEVVRICEARQRVKPRIDPMLVMDDLHDKLQLLD